MKTVKWLGVAAGIAALAACGGADEANISNADDLNAMATDNMALPPVDMNADLNADMNAMTNDVANDMNMVDNTENSTVNGY